MEDFKLTFSIVARDQKTGEIGVAVQSHHFSVGTMVPWARSGVGAVATQSMAERSYGPLGLDLMASRIDANRALKGLLATDEFKEWRQVAMVDSNGNVAAFTGKKCTPYAGVINSTIGKILLRHVCTDGIFAGQQDLPQVFLFRSHAKNLDPESHGIVFSRSAGRRGGFGRKFIRTVQTARSPLERYRCEKRNEIQIEFQGKAFGYISYTDAVGYVMSKSLGLKFLTGDEAFKNLENVEFVK